MPDKLHILGIDPSYTETGVALIDAATLKVIMACTIKTSNQSMEWDRLYLIHRQLSSVLAENKITCAAIETPFVGRNFSTAIKLGSVRGVCFLSCRMSNTCILPYNPMYVKSTITGNNCADKGTVARFVSSMTGYKTSNHNISDAIAVALCGALELKSKRLAANAR